MSGSEIIKFFLEITIAVLTILYFYWLSSSRLKRLLSVIDGKISKKFMRGGPQRCLIGTFEGTPVDAVFSKGERHADFFITLYLRCHLPCSTVCIFPSAAPLTSDVMMNDLDTFLHGKLLEIPQAKIKVISGSAQEQAVLNFLTLEHMKILEYIFAQGFNYIEIHQEESSDSYIRVGYQYKRLSMFTPASKSESVIKPAVVNNVLTLLKCF